MLVAAAFDADAAMLTLGFDRDIDIGGLVPLAFGVSDNVSTGIYFVNSGDVQQPSGTTVALSMVYDTGAAGSGVVLYVTADNGIVAVDGDWPWNGVSGVDLPFAQAAIAEAA